jgi:hypothetical protein
VANAEQAAAAGGDIVMRAGHVVAELSFGFWTGLLANRYHARLWEPALRRSFPLLPPGVTRRSLHRRVESVRRLRNRVAHHEPVFGRDLAGDHRDILELLGH